MATDELMRFFQRACKRFRINSVEAKPLEPPREEAPMFCCWWNTSTIWRQKCKVRSRSQCFWQDFDENCLQLLTSPSISSLRWRFRIPDKERQVSSWFSTLQWSLVKSFLLLRSVFRDRDCPMPCSTRVTDEVAEMFRRTGDFDYTSLMKMTDPCPINMIKIGYWDLTHGRPPHQSINAVYRHEWWLPVAGSSTCQSKIKLK